MVKTAPQVWQTAKGLYSAFPVPCVLSPALQPKQSKPNPAQISCDLEPLPAPWVLELSEPPNWEDQKYSNLIVLSVSLRQDLSQLLLASNSLGPSCLSCPHAGIWGMIHYILLVFCFVLVWFSGWNPGLHIPQISSLRLCYILVQFTYLCVCVVCIYPEAGC